MKQKLLEMVQVTAFIPIPSDEFNFFWLYKNGNRRQYRFSGEKPFLERQNWVIKLGKLHNLVPGQNKKNTMIAS